MGLADLGMTKAPISLVFRLFLYNRVMEKREQIRTSEYTYTIVLDPAEEGGFVVTVPALAGCITQGETLDEAREMAAEAIESYLESLRKHGDPIPVGEEHDNEPIREQVTVSLKTV